jgi:hypothetical protein
MKAYFVVGPEGSGTKLTTKILVYAGCQGQFSHTQETDTDDKNVLANIPPPNSPFVIRRSIPHGCFVEIDLEKIKQQLVDAGYEVFFIITYRNWYGMLCSNYKGKDAHTDTEEHANLKTVIAYKSIFKQLIENNINDFLISSFDIKVQNPSMCINKFLNFIGLPSLSEEEIQSMEIKNTNEKWYT